MLHFTHLSATIKKTVWEKQYMKQTLYKYMCLNARVHSSWPGSNSLMPGLRFKMVGYIFFFLSPLTRSLVLTFAFILLNISTHKWRNSFLCDCFLFFTSNGVEWYLHPKFLLKVSLAYYFDVTYAFHDDIWALYVYMLLIHLQYHVYYERMILFFM